ncbi:hypothetical protein NG42_02350 [Winslowiella iniecta]|uniref:Uncharacterized protein n=1 Tax=Winslowiella iniecta TaxID=1560201 RepID=A0A0L7T7X6_9GAMM|nr:hypothetical protein NG43_15675 [Winslowiella iniecta]KOC92074.1 hypothetical protein NG42_02350 [Winslowiella iniecta]
MPVRFNTVTILCCVKSICAKFAADAEKMLLTRSGITVTALVNNPLLNRLHPVISLIDSDRKFDYRQNIFNQNQFELLFGRFPACAII